MRFDQYFPTIIDDLYAGTLDEASWRRAIIGVADLVSGAAVFIFCVNPSMATVLRDEVYRWDPVAAEQYRKFWFARDIRVEPSIAISVGEPIFEARLMPVCEWQASEIYNDFLKPNDSPWFLAFFLHKAPNRIVNFSINSSRDRGAFDQRDGDRLRPLVPHLRRALEIKDRLELANIRQETVGKCLDSLSFAVLILDEGGKVVEASTSARKLLGATESGIKCDADGTLWLHEPAGRDLHQWIAKGVPPEHNRDGLLHVARSIGHPLSITVTRLPEMSPSWIGGSRPCWMLLLFDPDRQLGASTELIARDMGVSIREADVAVLLANGCDLAVVAQRLHISVHTARTHLKSIFSKTGICSQADLVRRVASGPIPVRP